MTIRVMSYNVRYFGHALRGAGSTRGALVAIAEAIAGLEALPELVCLQEVETRSIRSRLSHTPGRKDETQLEALMGVLDQALERSGRSERYTGHYFPAHTYRIGPARLYTTGLAILALDGVELDSNNAEAPVDVTHRRIKRIAKWKQSRICAHARFRDAGGGVVDLFNTHLSLPAFVSKRMFERQPRMGYGENQALEVERLAEFVEATRHSDRFLVLGDFNALPASPAYDRALERLGMLDPFPAAMGTDPLRMRTEWPTAGFLNLRMRLDHIFMGRGLECLDFEDTHPFGREGRWHGLSDHVPLLARFR